MSWTVDVVNPATGDDFVLFVKELQLPDGQRRPYSMWLSGAYPRVFDGLCKSLSFDMRVIDPAWIGAKLRQLADFPGTPRRLPGLGARASSGSKATPRPSPIWPGWCIHRYFRLGLLDEDGFPIEEMGLLHYEADHVVPLRSASAGAMEVRPGQRCGGMRQLCGDPQGWLRFLHGLRGDRGVWVRCCLESWPVRFCWRTLAQSSADEQRARGSGTL